MAYNDKFLAKSDGTTLLRHSECVSDVALVIAKLNNTDISETILDAIKYSSLLHDIGKISSDFQKYLKSGKHKKKKKDAPLYLHNQIGWSVLSEFELFGEEVEELVYNSVYWHHGVYDNLYGKTSKDIINLLPDEDVENIVNYISNIKPTLIRHGEYAIEPFYYRDIPKTDNRRERVPIQKRTERFNRDITFVRGCVIGADRLVSSYDINMIEALVKTGGIEDFINSNYLNKSNTSTLDVTKSKYYIDDKFKVRFEKQIEISNNINGSTIIKAPAGFGKTLLGVLWGLNNSKKVIWVCPRNIVAQSAYKSVTEELEALGVKSTVELYLHNEVVASNSDTKGLESDFTITNIDSFLSTTTINGKLNNIFVINNANVIFDECHELNTESALFSCFVNIMRVRHQVIKNDTLLLSATPIYMEYLWDTLTNKSNILPDYQTHYDAAHNGNYNINIVNEDILHNIDFSKNNLCVLNSIKNSQEIKKIYNFGKLLHSKFEAAKRENDFSDLLSEYGKYSQRTLNKSNIVGTHIIQASLDVSFLNLYESVMSPESTLQRIGRIDRWGDYSETPNINIFKYDDDDKAIDFLYNTELMNLWYNFISEHKGVMTLNELYVIYNSFNCQYRDKIKIYVSSKYYISLERLGKITPIKYSSTTKKTDVMSAGSNKLRANGNEVFYIVKRHDGTYTEPFSEAINNLTEKDYDVKDLDLIKDIRTNLMTDDRFVFKSIRGIKRKTTAYFKNRAKKSDLPFVKIKQIYDDELGIVNK